MGSFRVLFVRTAVTNSQNPLSFERRAKLNVFDQTQGAQICRRAPSDGRPGELCDGTIMLDRQLHRGPGLRRLRTEGCHSELDFSFGLGWRAGYSMIEFAHLHVLANRTR
eukprot:1374760-Amorphochlora_amoeboformis.AAC.1